MWDHTESAVEVAREARRKEKAEAKAAKDKAVHEAEAHEKYTKELEKTIAKVFKEFVEWDGSLFWCSTGPSLPGRKKWMLHKQHNLIAEAYVGYREWDNPNYDHKVTEGGNVIIWSVDGHETFTEGWLSFEKAFGYAMRNHI